MSDFEDCLQDECTVHVNADYIVTCNPKDFREARTTVVTPDVFLKILRENELQTIGEKVYEYFSFRKWIRFGTWIADKIY